MPETIADVRLSAKTTRRFIAPVAIDSEGSCFAGVNTIGQEAPMPDITWNVDDARITLKDHGRLGVTVVLPGQPELPIPPMTLGQWAVPFPGRQVELRYPFDDHRRPG